MVRVLVHHNKINKQIITECSRLPNVNLINHSNLLEPELDLLHDTKHIKRQHIGLFVANLIDAIRGRPRQPRYTSKSSNMITQLKTVEHNRSMSNFGLFFFFHPNELNFCMWSPI